MSTPMTILLVEDSEDNRFLFNMYFKNMSELTVDIANDGKEALEKFKEGNYDLVFMDIEMPLMDGYTTTKEIRSWERKKGAEPTTIIGLSAHATKDIKEKCLKAGMNDYLSKPLKKKDLLAKISDFSSCHKLSNKVKDEDEKADKESPHDENLLDMELLNNLTDGDDEILQEFLASLLKNIPKYMSHIEKAIGNRDYRELFTSAHRLKSSILSTGAKKTCDLLNEFELMGSRENIRGAKKGYGLLIEDIEKLKKEIREIAKPEDN